MFRPSRRCSGDNKHFRIGIPPSDSMCTGPVCMYFAFCNTTNSNSFLMSLNSDQTYLHVMNVEHYGLVCGCILKNTRFLINYRVGCIDGGNGLVAVVIN